MDVFLVPYSSVAAIRAIAGSVHVFAPSSSSSTAAAIGAVITRIGASVVRFPSVAAAIRSKGNDVEGACHQYPRIVVGVSEKRWKSWLLQPPGALLPERESPAPNLTDTVVKIIPRGASGMSDHPSTMMMRYKLTWAHFTAEFDQQPRDLPPLQHSGRPVLPLQPPSEDPMRR